MDPTVILGKVWADALELAAGGKGNLLDMKTIIVVIINNSNVYIQNVQGVLAIIHFCVVINE